MTQTIAIADRPPASPVGRGEWAAGWGVVLASFVGLASASMPAATLGVMLKPLTTAYGWSRTEFTAGFTIVAIVMLLLSGPVGAAVDRFGARRVTIPGLVLIHLGFAGLAFTGPSILRWYMAMGVIGVGLAAAGPLGWAPAITSRFTSSRAFALGVVLTGSGFAASFTPFLGGLLLSSSGPKAAFLGLAALGLAMSLPLALLLFRDASDLARSPRHRAVAPVSVEEMPGYAAGQAFATSRFWRLCIAMIAIAGGTGVLNIHLMAHLVENGASKTGATVALSILGPASIVGRLASGYLADRFSVPIVAGCAFALAALGDVVISLGAGNLPAVWIAMLLVGAAAGAESDVGAFAVSRYFGLKAFGTLFGVMMAGVAFAFGFAPMVAAFARDSLGSYESVLLCVAASAALAAVLAATLGRYPDFARSPGLETWSTAIRGR